MTEQFATSRVDSVDHWTREKCNVGPKCTGKADDLLFSFNRFAGPKGYETLGKRNFLIVLRRLGFHYDTSNSYLLGISVSPSDSHAETPVFSDSGSSV